VRKRRQCINALQLETALESGQATTGVNGSYVAANLSSTFHIQWNGIMLLNNFENDESGVRV